MNSELLKILNEQNVFLFNGRINVLGSSNRQILGIILFLEGEIVSVTFDGLFGKKALFNIIIREREKSDLKFFIEPEIIENVEVNIAYKTQVLLEKLVKEIENYQKFKKLRPPDQLNFFIKNSFLKVGAQITPNEFQLLCIIFDFSLVKDIYSNCKLMEHEITEGLISLRKNNAIWVK